MFLTSKTVCLDLKDFGSDGKHNEVDKHLQKLSEWLGVVALLY